MATGPEVEHGQGDEDVRWMSAAMTLARQAQGLGEVPVGAVLVLDGDIIGEGCNRLITDADPTAHAEMVAIRQAAKRMGNYRLPGTTLYVTLEPCSMCAGAIIQARIQRVVFATPDPRTGAGGSVYQILDSPHLNHRCQVDSGINRQEASDLLRDFFRQRRLESR
ncbi:MAG: tRNA adenosine(34) deaminase TadA [Wenzhouxiangella sp.]|nr:MAG: tRNA adenosine(34) deaminase TadA [Wenzhouxiangella sp.]